MKDPPKEAPRVSSALAPPPPPTTHRLAVLLGRLQLLLRERQLPPHVRHRRPHAPAQAGRERAPRAPAPPAPPPPPPRPHSLAQRGGVLVGAAHGAAGVLARGVKLAAQRRALVQLLLQPPLARRRRLLQPQRARPATAA